MVPLLETRNLTKDFGEFKVVNSLSLTVNQGDVYGFLGQNGAGKSTTLRMILGLISPTEGEIVFRGKNCRADQNSLLRATGAVIEKPDLYKYLTAFENLSIFARLSGVKLKKSQLIRQLEIAGIAERAHSKVKTFSQGMKQRLGIAIALVHDPELVILDEPTNGLDPQGIAEMRHMIINMTKEAGKTVIVSSHLLYEIEMMATRMIIIHRGKKITEGRVNELLDPANTIVQVTTDDDVAALRKIQQSPRAASLAEPDELKFRLHKNEIADLTAELVAMNIGITSVQPKHSLEDYFLNLTNSDHHAATAAN